MNTETILTLLKLPGVDRRAVHRLQATISSSSEDPSLEGWIERGTKHRLLAGNSTAAEIQEARNTAREEIKGLKEKGIHILGHSDPRFPRQLQNIPDPPALLYLRGKDDFFSESQAVAVVGTREPTQYGRRVAERAAYLFAEHGFIVASGLAEGCDTHAHKGCLAARGKTVAVMAHGLQMIYPRGNARLAEDIVGNGGALVSEYAWGMKPERRFFVERDRLQSGLSDAVVVVETDVSGGTMHTVSFCLKQGRILVCVGHPESMKNLPKVQGNLKLLESGKARRLGSSEEFQGLLVALRGRQQERGIL